MQKFTEAGTSNTITTIPAQPSTTNGDDQLKDCLASIQLLETYIRDTANALLDKVNLREKCHTKREWFRTFDAKQAPELSHTDENPYFPRTHGFCAPTLPPLQQIHQN